MFIYNHLQHFQVSQTPSPQLSVAKLLCKVPLNKVPPTLAPASRRSHLSSPPEVNHKWITTAINWIITQFRILPRKMLWCSKRLMAELTITDYWLLGNPLPVTIVTPQSPDSSPAGLKSAWKTRPQRDHPVPTTTFPSERVSRIGWLLQKLLQMKLRQLRKNCWNVWKEGATKFWHFSFSKLCEPWYAGLCAHSDCGPCLCKVSSLTCGYFGVSKLQLLKSRPKNWTWQPHPGMIEQFLCWIKQYYRNKSANDKTFFLWFTC